MITLTDKLYLNGLTFYFTGIQDNNRVYTSLDELTQHTIKTAIADFDSALIGVIDESLSDITDDDFIRYFDSMTGIEE